MEHKVKKQIPVLWGLMPAVTIETAATFSCKVGMPGCGWFIKTEPLNEYLTED